MSPHNCTFVLLRQGSRWKQHERLTISNYVPSICLFWRTLHTGIKANWSHHAATNPHKVYYTSSEYGMCSCTKLDSHSLSFQVMFFILSGSGSWRLNPFPALRTLYFMLFLLLLLYMNKEKMIIVTVCWWLRYMWWQLGYVWWQLQYRIQIIIYTY